MPEITLIFAMDRDRAIGKNGTLPWHLSADLKHFSEITRGGVVVMGRKTYDSLPPKFKPLPNRENVVLTRDHSLSIQECAVFHSANEIVSLYNTKEIFVIGGAEVFSLFLNYATRMIVTHVNAKVEGDTFFPKVSGEWYLKKQLLFQEADTQNQFPFTITEYSKR